MNVFGMGPGELILIMIMALIIFGPERLPMMMAKAGRLLREVRRMTDEMSREFTREINLSSTPEFKEVSSELRNVSTGWKEMTAGLREAVRVDLGNPSLTEVERAQPTHTASAYPDGSAPGEPLLPAGAEPASDPLATASAPADGVEPGAGFEPTSPPDRSDSNGVAPVEVVADHPGPVVLQPAWTNHGQADTAALQERLDRLEKQLELLHEELRGLRERSDSTRLTA